MKEKVKILLIASVILLFLWDYHSKSEEIVSLKETIYTQNEAIISQNFLLRLYEQKLFGTPVPAAQFKFKQDPI